ncbi:MAG: beta-galactosidase [Verrucomicrobiota bacterium]
MPAAEGAAVKQSAPPLLPDLGLKSLGRLKPRAAREIAASPLSIGFETLDRQLFDPEKTYPYMAQLGAKWARCQAGWARTEREKGKYDFTWLDAVVDSLLKIGVQPWFNLSFGNPLYTPEADPTAVGWVPVFTEEAREGWLNHARAISQHFADRVKHWEIWNEPNITDFWKPGKPNAAEYVKLVKQTAPIIRERVPGAKIIGGVFCTVPRAYIQECMEAGLGDVIDKLSFHPYRKMPEQGYEADVNAMNTLLSKHTRGRVKLWQGENGCPSQSGGSGALADLDWNETLQAKWLLRRVLSDLRLGIELTSYFLIVDLVGYRGKTNYKGLLRGTDYTPKPAFFAYQSLATLFDAETQRTETGVQADGAAPGTLLTASFERQGFPLHVYWMPADLLKDCAPKKLQITVPAPLKQPVLVAPMTGEIFALQASAGEPGKVIFHDLPLLDQPLIITDLAVVR